MAMCTAAIALTLHLGFAGSYNSIHPNFTCVSDNLIGSILLNSEKNISVYGGVLIGEYVDVGLATGYSGGSPVRPIARLKYKNLFVMPGYDGEPGITLGINIPFGGGE